MNIKNLLLVLSSAAALTSCSTAYRSGQTPDDVYFSPTRPQQDEYVDVSRQQGRYEDATGYNSYDQAYDNYRDDRFLRMSLGNQMRLSAYNDYSMYYGGLGYNTWRYNNYYSMGFNSPWSGLSYWNSFYNPYSNYDYITPAYYGYGYGYGGGFGGYLPGSGTVKSPSLNPISRPRTFNSGAYGVSNNSYTNTSQYIDRPAAATTNSRYAPVNSGGRYNNSNSGSAAGNSLRRVLSGSSDNSYYNNGRSTTNSSSRNSGTSNQNSAPVRTYEAPARSYSPPASSSSSGGGAGSSSGGGGGGVSRPTRGGGN